MELFKVEKEQAAAAAAEARPPIAFPRYSVWLVAIGMFLVIAGWLVSFPVNEAVKKMAGSNDYVDGITTAAKWLFFPGTVLVAISLWSSDIKRPSIPDRLPGSTSPESLP